MERGRDLGKTDATQLVASLPPISRTELARLRRGELDADAVAALVERTTVLGAPPAPPQGDLIPNQSGWLIGPGQPLTLQAGAASKRAGISRLLSYALYLGALEFLHWHWYFALLPALAPLFFAFGATTSPRARLKRQLERAGQVASLADAVEGALVRVCGTIVPQPAVRGSFLLDPPRRTREPPACGPVCPEAVGDGYVLRSHMLRRDPLFGRLLGRYESSVGPGDRIEVCGVVRHVLAPELRSLRDVPTRPVLGAADDTPLLVRRPLGG